MSEYPRTNAFADIKRCPAGLQKYIDVVALWVISEVLMGLVARGIAYQLVRHNDDLKLLNYQN
jgi:hypothetical protein